MQDDREPIDWSGEGRRPDGSARPCPLRIGIVGLGAVGASLGLALQRAGHVCSGFDVNPTHMRKALHRGAVNRAVDRLSDLAKCDAIFLCVPPGRVKEVRASLRTCSEATLIDVASAKSFLAGTHDPRFVLSHPMRGSNLSGPDAAKEGLFEGGTWVITPLEETSPESLLTAEDLIRSTGAVPVRMDPQTHDRICARISHLSHVLSSALALTCLSQESTLAHLLAGASFRDMTRIARGNPLLWRDVLITNKEAVVPVLMDFIERLQGFAQALQTLNIPAVEAFFCDAADLVDDACATAQDAATPKVPGSVTSVGGMTEEGGQL